jgi:DNA-binding transcriptional LysR family regulator
VLATARSISRAARQLHLSPSALSRQLARLEARLGILLARRTASGLELTDGGRRLLRHAELWHELEHELLAELRGATRALAGFVRVAGYSSSMRSLLMPALAPLLRSNPALQVHFITLELSRVHAHLIDGHAEFALSLSHCPRQGIHNHALGEERNVLVESSQHRTRDEVYIDHEPGDNFTEFYFHQRCGRVPARFRRSYAHDIYGLIDAVAFGLGRAVLPRHLLHEDTRLRVVKELGELALPVVLHHHERVLHSRNTRAVLEALVTAVPALLQAPPAQVQVARQCVVA